MFVTSQASGQSTALRINLTISIELSEKSSEIQSILNEFVANIVSYDRNIRSFRKPRLSQIVQIQRQFTEEYSFRNANKLLFYKKQNVNSFLLSQRFLE